MLLWWIITGREEPAHGQAGGRAHDSLPRIYTLCCVYACLRRHAGGTLPPGWLSTLHACWDTGVYCTPPVVAITHIHVVHVSGWGNQTVLHNTACLKASRQTSSLLRCMCARMNHGSCIVHHVQCSTPVIGSYNTSGPHSWWIQPHTYN